MLFSVIRPEVLHSEPESVPSPEASHFQAGLKLVSATLSNYGGAVLDETAAALCSETKRFKTLCAHAGVAAASGQPDFGVRVLGAVAGVTPPVARSHLARMFALAADEIVLRRMAGRGRRGAGRDALAHLLALEDGERGIANQLTVGHRRYPMTQAHIAGALASRMGGRQFNPYPRSSPGHGEWEAGRALEFQGEHVRGGVDVLALPPEAAVVADDWKSPSTRPGALDDSYALALGQATGMLDAVRTYMSETQPYVQPREMRCLLLAAGHACSVDLADAMIARIRHEWASRPVEMTPEQSEALGSLDKPRRDLILAIARRAERKWRTLPCVDEIASDMRRPVPWVANTLQQAGDAGMGHLVDCGRNGRARLTPLGWAAAALLRGDVPPKAPTPGT